MNFTEIFNGMVGKDFIVAFNDNFRKSDAAFLEILATMIYKVKSTDIKEFRVIDGVVSYTTEEEPAEGEEDNRTWTPVDITAWGNISGNIEDQADLKAILDDKAALDTVVELSNLLTTLRQEFNNLRNNYEDTEVIVTANQNDIADLKEVDRTKVSSPNIKGIRVSDAEFQWSVDGITWYSMQRSTSVAWGNLTGDINNQDDLMALFRDINATMDELSDTVIDLSNQVASRSADIDGLLEDMNTLTGEFNDLSDEVAGSVGVLNGEISNLKQKDQTLETTIGQHTSNTNNPHNVNKAQLGLENVDNTADINKPISNPQKEYVDAAVAGGIDTSNLVININGARGLFVGEDYVYNNISADDKAGTLAFVLFSDWRSKVLSVLNIESLDGYTNRDRLILKNRSGGKYNENEYYCNFGSGGTGSIGHIPEGSYDFDLRVNVDQTITGFDGINVIIGNNYNRLNIEEADAEGLNIINKVKSSVGDYLDVLMFWVADGVTITGVVKEDEPERELSVAYASTDPSHTVTNSSPAPGYGYALYEDHNQESEEYVKGVALGNYVVTYRVGQTTDTTTVTVTADNICEPIIIEEGE
jgi:predicted  nucleic acid-binding Zn-ribbon protein